MNGTLVGTLQLQWEGCFKPRRWDTPQKYQWKFMVSANELFHVLPALRLSKSARLHADS